MSLANDMSVTIASWFDISSRMTIAPRSASIRPRTCARRSWPRDRALGARIPGSGRGAELVRPRQTA
jgi:hypothetical protein